MTATNRVWGSFFHTFSFFDKRSWVIEDSTKVLYSLFLVPEWDVNIKSFFEMVPFKEKQINDMNEWKEINNSLSTREALIARLKNEINPPKEWKTFLKDNPTLESLYNTMCEADPLQITYFEKQWTTKQFCAFYLTLYHGEWDSTDYKVAIKVYRSIDNFITNNKNMDVTQAVNIIKYIGF